jgi:ribosome biogenesis GTPase
MNKGLVVKSTGSWYLVRHENEIIKCRIKGKFRTKGIRTTNPIAVGDKVGWDMEEDGIGTISEIEQRENYIIRKSINLSKESHIIAANMDQAFLFVTVHAPQTSTGFIDRFLVTAEAYSIPVQIIFNKMDTYNQKWLDKVDELENIYTNIGYPCHRVVATSQEGVAYLSALMKDKITLLSGHSGVGKSTLINSLEDLEIKTDEVSDSHNKGKHTTTFAEMYPLKIGGYVVDTPGIKGFGVIDIEKEELGHFFPEIRDLMSECKFNNCVHLNEPGCVVKQAVSVGEISESRYINYLSLYNNEDGQHYR